MLPGTIGELIKLPFERRDYPRIKARLQEVLDDYDRIQLWELKQGEEALIKEVQTAVESLKKLSKAVTLEALFQRTHLTHTQVRKYPLVLARLKQLIEGSQMEGYVRSFYLLCLAEHKTK